MTITVNPDLNLVVEQPLSRQPLAVVKLPRGPKVPIWVQFARDGAVIDPSEALTSGTLVVGLYYKITTFVAGDSFTNVGAASNATSVYFLCTGTTPTTWTNSSTLQQCDSAGVLFSLIFSVKKHQEYDGAVLVLASGTDFTKFGTGTSTIFKSKCSFSTAEINTLLGVDASVANDGSEVTLMGEVSWLGPDESKAFPFQIDLQNDSYKTNDVVTSTPGVQAMSLVTTGTEALLPGSKVLTAGSNITITVASGTVTIASSASGGTWGSITGTLSAQTDLQSALNAKQDALTLGTGVATALAVSVGSAGAFITFGGDAGTPSALVGTNITGTASGLTAGNATLAADVDPAGTDIAAALAGKLPLAGGTMDENAVVNLFNDSKWQQSAQDKGIAGTAGFSIICSADYEYKFANGFLFILSDGSSTVRKVLYAPATPTVTDDTTLGYTTDTTWEMADGTTYECTDVTEGAAVWAVVPAFDLAAPGVIGGTTADVVNTTGLNVKDSGGTTTASIDGVAGTASFLNGAVVITDSPYNQIDAYGIILYIGTVYADNALNISYDGGVTQLVTIGANNGTEAWIHSDGTASFLSGAVVITDSPYNEISAPDASLYIDTVLADNGLWINDGVTTVAGLDSDGTAQFKTGAITLGKNTGTAAYIDENGKAWFSGGQTVVEAGNVSSYQFTAVETVTIGVDLAGTLNVKDSGGNTTASIDGADGSASFGYQGGNIGLMIDQYGNITTNNSAEATLYNLHADNLLTVGKSGNAGTLNVKDSSDTTTASISGADGSASFANGACTIDNSGYIYCGTVYPLGIDMGTTAINSTSGSFQISGADGTASFANGECTIDAAGTLTLASTLIGGTQSLVTSGGAGAVNLTTLTTEVETTGTLDALTLANGTVGQPKIVAHTAGAFTSVLTPTTALGFTSITFLASLGQTCTLEYTNAGWVILAVGGLTLPVIA